MYKFYYEYLKPKYGDRVQLLCTDTDSLILLIYTEDVYEDFYNDRHLFDLSNYPVNNPFRDPSNNKVVGMMKDETAGKPIREFVGSRPKMYAYLVEGGKEQKRAKGIQRSVVANVVRFEDYKSQLFAPESTSLVNHRFESKLHQIRTIEQRKSGICCYDNKRSIHDDNIHTTAWGHYSLPQLPLGERRAIVPSVGPSSQ